MTDHLLQTTVVGSYPQPDWLVNREMLSKVVPRTRLKEIWRVPEAYLQQAQDDATLLAIRDMERAGIDIITDGEMRRESYSNHFATALDGIDQENPGYVIDAVGPEDAGAARRRQDPAHAAGRGARHAVPARQHRPAGQDHPARPLHHGPAGQGRVLQGRRGDVHGLCRGGERGGARAGEGRRRRDPARRAVAAQQSGGSQPLRRQGDQPRAPGHQRADGRPSLLRLRRRGARPQQAHGLHVPAAARRHHRPADLDRIGPAQDRSRRAEGSRAQEGHAGRHRPQRSRDRDCRRRSPNASAPA